MDTEQPPEVQTGTPPSVLPEQPKVSGNPADEVRILKELTMLVIYVLFVGFAVLIVSVIFGAGAWYTTYAAEKQATYEDLKDQVLLQNAKIDALTHELELQQMSGQKD